MSTTAEMTNAVRKATDADLDLLTATLAEAFFADPVMSWCYPDPGRRGELLPEGFRVLLDAALPHGGVDTVADELAGAIWIPPEAELDEEKLAADLGTVSAEYTERMFTLLELLDTHHPTDQAHQYLFVLGTRQRWQSRGLGSALLRAVLDDCDRDGTPAYLEASSERNRRLYERHGFAIREVVTLPDGPPLWCMWRDAGGTA